MDPPTIVTALWLAAAGRNAPSTSPPSLSSTDHRLVRPARPLLLRKSKRPAQEEAGHRAHGDARGSKRSRQHSGAVEKLTSASTSPDNSSDADEDRTTSLDQVSAPLLGRVLGLADWSALDESGSEAAVVGQAHGDDSESAVNVTPQELVQAWRVLWGQSQRYWVETILTLFDLAILFGDPSALNSAQSQTPLTTIQSPALASTSRKATVLVSAVAGSHANSTQAQLLWSKCPGWRVRASLVPGFASQLLHLYISNHLLHFSASSTPPPESINTPTQLSALLRFPPKWHRRLAAAPTNPLLSSLVSDTLAGAAQLLGPGTPPSATTLVAWLTRTGANPTLLIHTLSVLHTLSTANPQSKQALESTISTILTNAVHTSNLVHFTLGLLLIRTLHARTPKSYEQWLTSVVWSNTLSLFPTSPPSPALSSSWYLLLADLIPHDDPTYLAAHMRASSSAPPATHAFGGSMAVQATCPWRPAAHAYHKRLVERVGEFGGEDAGKDAVWVLQQVLAPAPAAAAATKGKGGKAAAVGKAIKPGAGGLARASSTGAFRPIPDTLFSWCLVKRKWVEQRLLPAFWGMYSGATPGVEIAGASPGTIRRAIAYVMEALVKDRRVSSAVMSEWYEVRDDPTAAAGAANKQGGGDKKGVGEEEASAGATQAVVGTQMASVEDARMTLVVRIGAEGKFVLRPFGPSLLTSLTRLDSVPQSVRLQHLIAFTLNSPSSPLVPTRGTDFASLASLARTLAALLVDESQHWPVSSTFAHIDAPLCAPWTSLAPPGSILPLNPLDMLLVPWLTQASRPALDHFIAALFLACIERTSAAAGVIHMHSMFAASPVAWPWAWSVEALHKLRYAAARNTQVQWMQSVARILGHDEDTGMLATPVHWVAAWMAEEHEDGRAAATGKVPVCGTVVDLVVVACEVGLRVATVRELVAWLVDGLERGEQRKMAKRWRRELMQAGVDRLGMVGREMAQAVECELDMRID